MALDLTSINEAIAQTRESLDAAGYDVQAEDSGGTLLLTVKARADACEDCLVPKEVMTSIVRDELSERGLAVHTVAVVYPSDG